MLEEAKLLDDDYDADGRRTWGTNIELDGVTYATSLFWQPLQNKDDPFTEVGEASEGVMEGADLFCIKQGKAPQAVMPAALCPAFSDAFSQQKNCRHS